MKNASKGKKITLAVLGALLLALLIAYLLYTRPMPVEQLYPDVDLSDCTGVHVYYIVEQADGYNARSIDYDREAPELDRLLQLLRTQRFRRSLRNLRSGASHAFQLNGGDFRFWLSFDFSSPQPDGSMRTSRLEVEDLYGRIIDLYYTGGQRYDCFVAPLQDWRQEVFAVFDGAGAPVE